jgi:hypothetical protein
MRDSQSKKSPRSKGWKRSRANSSRVSSSALLPKSPNVVLTLGRSLARDGGRSKRPETYLRSSARLLRRESLEARGTSPHSASGQTLVTASTEFSP